MRRFLCFLALLVQIVTWAPARSRLLAPNHDPSSQQPGTGGNLESLHAPYNSKQGSQEKAEISEEASTKGLNKIGSRPPNCEHKCDGCIPCVAIQVPTITDHFGVQYTNYEPESWKCKCGPSFYSP